MPWLDRYSCQVLVSSWVRTQYPGAIHSTITPSLLYSAMQMFSTITDRFEDRTRGFVRPSVFAMIFVGIGFPQETGKETYFHLFPTRNKRPPLGLQTSRAILRLAFAISSAFRLTEPTNARRVGHRARTDCEALPMCIAHRLQSHWSGRMESNHLLRAPKP